MTHYQELTLLQHEDVPLFALWGKVYVQIHLALTELQAASSFRTAAFELCLILSSFCCCAFLTTKKPPTGGFSMHTCALKIRHGGSVAETVGSKITRLRCT